MAQSEKAMTTLKEMLNNKGFKKYSEVNPLLLQSEVIEIVQAWLTQKRQNFLDTTDPHCDKSPCHPSQLRIYNELLEELK